MNSFKHDVELMLRAQAESAKVKPSDELRGRTLSALRDAEREGSAGSNGFEFSSVRSGANWKMAAGLIVTAGLACAASFLSGGNQISEIRVAEHSVEQGANGKAMGGVLFAKLERLTKPEELGREIVKPIDRQTAIFKQDMQRAWVHFQADLPTLPRLMKSGGEAF